MKIKYLGPRDSIRVGGYGKHDKDRVKEYPEEVGKELITTGVKQRFEAVDDPAAKEDSSDDNGKKKKAAKGK
jgi:hypothetical protein